MPKLVLIVDDSDADRGSVSVLLRQAGFAAFAVNNGREALERVASLRPALILLDMLMPAFDGWDFFELRSQMPDAASVPVVIVTGLEIASDSWAQGLGAVGLIRKPISPELLLAKVQEVIGVATENGIGHG